VIKDFRTFVFIGIMAAVFGLIFYTPLGLAWGIVTFAGLGMIEALLNQQINFLLWAVLWYLLTVELFWVILLKKAPQRYQLNDAEANTIKP
jgi:hypothetical protein